ncbi:C-terminal binding protein [Pseudonocardia sp. C8]|uniref:C-terminal binding protein n=1 Tax=Pseudonocardia sp. C8 TaxID=2762759 RepID=UPI0016429D06|nr:C-terminal binding protein [Pseudonocardia sp. C8]
MSARPIVVKTDGLLEVEPGDVDVFAGQEVDFRERTCLTEDELVDACADASGLLVLREPITARVLDALPACRVVSRFGIGLDTIDVDAATRRGVQVTNVPAANITEVAAHAVAMIMALTRRLPGYHDEVLAGGWNFRSPHGEIRRPGEQTVGLLGFGRIGRRVTAALTAVGFHVQVHDPGKPDDEVVAAGARPAGADEVVETSDVLSLHLPLTPRTRGILDAAALARTRPGVVVVNVSRGGLVDEEALADAVRRGHVAGAGLDTFAQEPLPADSPLRGLPNVLLSPHAAHYSADSYQETRRTAFADVARVLRGEPPRHPVNRV